MRDRACMCLLQRVTVEGELWVSLKIGYALAISVYDGYFGPFYLDISKSGLPASNIDISGNFSFEFYILNSYS